MLSLFSFVLLILSIAPLVVSSQDLEALKEIEEHLTKKVKLDTVETNSDEALAWRERLQTPSCFGKLSLKAKKNNNGKIEEILEKFKRIIDLINNESCTPTDYEFRDRLLEEIKTCPTCRRLNTMAQFYIEKHAYHCQEAHVKRFKQLRDDGQRLKCEASKALSKIRPFFDRLIYGELATEKNDIGFEHDEYLSWANDAKILETIYTQLIEKRPEFYSESAFDLTLAGLEYFIERLVIKDISFIPKSLTPDQAESIFMREVNDDCILFRRAFSSNVFWLANQDKQYLKERSFDQGDRDIADYYLTWATNNICYQIVNEPAYAKEMAQKIRQAAERKMADW